MGVKQALRHSWFTNRVHKREFEALYRRSIKDWKPRVHQGALIVDLCSLIQTRKPSQTDTGNSNVEQESQFSSTLEDASQDSLPFGDMTTRGCRAVSPTLSDPDLPEHNRVTDRSRKWEDENLLPVRPNREKWDWELNAPNYLPAQIPSAVRHTIPEFADDTNANEESYAIRCRKRTYDIWNELEDEVYEEVKNMVTGKRQQLVYGSNVFANVE